MIVTSSSNPDRRARRLHGIRLRLRRLCLAGNPLTLVVTGLRRHELLGLRWRHVDLIGNVLRVERSKSEAGERSVAIPPRLAEALWQHRRRSNYRGDDERVFRHPQRGSLLHATRFRADLGAALERAGISDHLRPFHDLRHASLTLGVVDGESALALMTRAGHASMSTTKVYLHLAGPVFRDEAERLGRALLTDPGPDHDDDGAAALYPAVYPSESISADLGESEPARQAE
jgi:integrase